jgi:hypothetical protein
VKIKYEYSTTYNFRPDELYGMGKESMKISNPSSTMEQFLETLSHNSSLKHRTAVEYIYGSEESIHREDWIPYIGQPMFYITDIKYEIIDEP